MISGSKEISPNPFEDIVNEESFHPDTYNRGELPFVESYVLLRRKSFYGLEDGYWDVKKGDWIKEKINSPEKGNLYCVVKFDNQDLYDLGKTSLGLDGDSCVNFAVCANWQEYRDLLEQYEVRDSQVIFASEKFIEDEERNGNVFDDLFNTWCVMEDTSEKRRGTIFADSLDPEDWISKARKEVYIERLRMRVKKIGRGEWVEERMFLEDVNMEDFLRVITRFS